jgi:hypothetical protein
MKPLKTELFLVLTHNWYDETESGRKRVEYRAITPKWRGQIWDNREQLKTVRFARGYTSRQIVCQITAIDIGPCPIPGWEGNFYRIHFT